MNKSALRKFATEARLELRNKVKMKALQLGITEDAINKETVQGSDSVFVDGRQLTKEEQRQRNKLIDRVTLKGFNQVIEEVAYTWFNRFTALRFMEVHNYLPTKVRVLSSIHEGSYEPDIIKEALNINLDIDKELVYNLKLSTDNDAMDKLYKYLILAQCNALANILPFMFGKTDDYTIILFPDGLLSEGSFLRRMTDIDIIPESDWDDVEIIGWLYQYYIAEENERVIKAKKRYKKEEIPFATQLFTPDWIVRYMVQNALGRYWVESYPEDRELINNWEFYLENPNPEPDFEEKLAPYLNKNMKVEEIKCFDPAMGSGHILVYMFDVLYEIYSKCGYMDGEIPKLIIENNLYGLDIDDRANQLACFSVIMKAQQYNSRFLRNLERQVRDTGDYIDLNLASIQETNGFGDDEIEYITGESSGEKFEKVKRFVKQFENAKIYGSLTEINEFDEGFLSKRPEEIIENPVSDIALLAAKEKVDAVLENLIKQTRIMDEVYDVLITNPPYMGSRYMNPILSEYLKKNFLSYADLFSCFIELSRKKVSNKGQIGFITPFVWMFISAYENLRKDIVKSNDISSLIELEYNSFEVAVVPVCTFTLRNYIAGVEGEFIKLSDFPGVENQVEKVLEAIENPIVEYRYSKGNSFFDSIPGSPIGYWIPNDLFEIFLKEKRLIELIDATGSQNITADNNRFLRYLWEVDNNKIQNKWALYTKGGKYRKWYGNLEHVVDWSTTTREFYKKNKSSNLLDEKYWFRKGLTYNGISNRGFSVRVAYESIYDKKGPTFHILDSNKEMYLLGLLNSKPINLIMNLYNPTMSYQKRDVDNLPIIIPEKSEFDSISKMAEENARISKLEWNNKEISYEYAKNELLTHIKNSNKLKEIVESCLSIKNDYFRVIKNNEEEINSKVIKLYKLEGYMTEKIDDKDVTINLSNARELIIDFISYAVGCMVGRYSLDEEGLIYTGGEFDLEKYQIFKADKDNVLPIVAYAYFEDDIISRFIKFVKVAFGAETLNENLEFIADTLGMKNNETPKETIRRYFVNDFFKDHVKMYKKRPIYWLFTSGKQKAFNALIYMHRYDSSTLARIRTDYLHVLQNRLEAQRQSLMDIVNSDESIKEKKQAEKELKAIDKQIVELKNYDEVLHHMADMQIEIDLDDGVVINYEKFNGLVAKI